MNCFDPTYPGQVVLTEAEWERIAKVVRAALGWSDRAYWDTTPIFEALTELEPEDIEAVGA